MPVLFLLPLLFVIAVTFVIMSRSTGEDQDVNRTREIGQLIDQKAMKLFRGEDVSDIDEQLRHLNTPESTP